MSTPGKGVPPPPEGTPGWPATADVNGHNSWNKNSKAKTAKCDVCSERIKKYSFDCTQCQKRVCSECVEVGGNSRPDFKYRGQRQVGDVCHCKWRFNGGQPPGFQQELEARGLVQLPPKRLEEDAANKRIKQEAVKRRQEAAAKEQQTLKKPKVEVQEPRRTTTKEKTSRQKLPAGPCKHLANNSTVILGGGIVGLCIARELALKLKATGTNHTIHLVEPQQRTGQLASSGCAGLISIHGWPAESEALVNLTLRCWSELVGSGEGPFAAPYFVKNSVYQVSKRKGSKGEHKPDWYDGQPKEDFVDDDSTLGKIDTAKFASWLRAECVRLRVRMLEGSEVVKVGTDGAGNLSSMEIQQVANGGEPSSSRFDKCNNLVIAAGPSTLDVYTRLFPTSSLELENIAKRASWLSLPTHALAERDNVGLIFSGLTPDGSVLDDKIVMAARPGRQEIIILGTHDDRQDDEEDDEKAAVDDGGIADALGSLKSVAEERLCRDGISDTATSGSGWISWAAEQRPIIDQVPASVLGRNYDTNGLDPGRGVWLCYGFGLHGTTFAPGAARDLVSRMFGEDSELGDSFKASSEYEDSE